MIPKRLTSPQNIAALPKTRSQNWAIAGLILPALLIFFLFFILPNFQIFLYSFQKWQGIAEGQWIGLKNYDRLLHDVYFWKSLWNTVLLSLNSICIQVPIALFVATALYFGVKGSQFFLVTFFIPMNISLVVIALVWKWWIYDALIGIFPRFLQALGATPVPVLGTSEWALIAVFVTINWIYIGLYIVMYTSGLKTIPKNIIDAARVDGLSNWKIGMKVLVPMLREIIAVTIVLSITGSFKSFDLIWLMTGGGPFHATEVVTIHLYRMAFRNLEFGYASTIAVVIFVFCVLAVWLQSALNRLAGRVKS